MKHIITLLTALLVLSTSALAFAGTTESEEDDGRVRLRSHSEWVHIPGLRWYIGNEAHGIGVGYLYALEMTYTFWEFGTTIRLGVGPDLLVVTRAFEGVDALAGYGFARASIFSGSRGGGIELGAGSTLAGLGLTPSVQGGIFLGGRHFEIGYAYQHPILGFRPVYMSSHQLTLRLNLPIFPH
ncbi:MAG: hypothetical protein ACNA8W_05010 [Bradymonadaceae bacterium]